MECTTQKILRKHRPGVFFGLLVSGSTNPCSSCLTMLVYLDAGATKSPDPIHVTISFLPLGCVFPPLSWNVECLFVVIKMSSDCLGAINEHGLPNSLLQKRENAVNLYEPISFVNLTTNQFLGNLTRWSSNLLRTLNFRKPIVFRETIHTKFHYLKCPFLKFNFKLLCKFHM